MVLFSQYLRTLLATFVSFSLITSCNQPSSTTTTTPPKTPTEVVSTPSSTISKDETKQMLGNLADKKMDNSTSSPEDFNGEKNTEDDLQTITNPDGTTTTHKKKHRHHHKKIYDRSPTGVLPGEGPDISNETQSSNQQASANGVVKTIPAKVYTILAYVLKNHQAPAGYVGGRVFTNFEKVLPVNDASGKKINYQEWDVNPHVNGVNRGTERLCTGDDKRYWYTNDHYLTFTQVIPK